MDFARRQLEKYGWSDGKGLGKHENGIAEALKPKLKRSVTGIGHDPAAEFNEHWWSALYDKAAKNVEVEEKNGKTKKIKTIDNFTISNSTWKIDKKQNTKSNEYSEYFIKKATLQNGGSKEESVSDSDIESDDPTKKDVLKMTDEELFAACDGRTAHKGARHGLRALGKLARIAEQEEMLLTQTKYSGYSHAKKIKRDNSKEVVENMSLENNLDSDCIIKKKKKKRKRCSSNEHEVIYECETLLKRKNKKKVKTKNVDSVTSKINYDEHVKNSGGQMLDNDSSTIENIKKVKKGKRKSKDLHYENKEFDVSKKKKKKDY